MSKNTKVPTFWVGTAPNITANTGLDFTNVTECRFVVTKPDGTKSIVTVASNDYGAGDDADQVICRLTGTILNQPSLNAPDGATRPYKLQIFTRNSGGAIPLSSEVAYFHVEQPTETQANVWA